MMRVETQTETQQDQHKVTAKTQKRDPIQLEEICSSVDYRKLPDSEALM
jgi:hypothetical protein